MTAWLAFDDSPDDTSTHYPPPHRHRWWCTLCGRFIKHTTVTTTYSRWDGERHDTGHCTTHGEVDVGWGPL